MTDKPGSLDPEHAFDPAKQDALEEAISKLSPEEAQFFLFKLETSLRKRKIQLSGYLAAIVVWLVSMVGALVYYGLTSGFVGWVFLVPFALVGLTLWAFGKWAERVAARQPPPELAMKAAPALAVKS